MATPSDVVVVRPTIVPLGDRALLVRFGDILCEAANKAATGFARTLADDLPTGIVEIVPNLISVLLRYDPETVQLAALAGEVRLRLYGRRDMPLASAASHAISVTFGGERGVDLDTVAAALAMTTGEFIAAHNAGPLRVLATGFAPGFVYCGFHSDTLLLPRRTEVRASVPAGTVLFAAGQTAIAATAIPTGWHVIGTTPFRNFDPATTPPTRMRAGDSVQFEIAP
ncbi:allophanate hydrolase subunit 1 [uncultured Devosia sp.]|uniref:5-oxoprolinase subunit B family protein n=1 Tax=uncultured Devosia sp. TaxID=211434 RepID=UPI0035CC0863